MTTSELAKKTCVPCKGGVPPLEAEQIRELLGQIDDRWKAENDHHIVAEYEYPDFLQALAAVNRIGQLAEEQGHHPDLELGWGRVGVKIWTHAIDGLTESDFILAAKIDEVI